MSETIETQSMSVWKFIAKLMLVHNSTLLYLYALDPLQKNTQKNKSVFL